MGRRKRDLHYGVRSGNGTVIRTSVSDRSSKSARPWNEPDVVDASELYGVKLTSYKQVHAHENALEDMGSLLPEERFTCRECGKLKSRHEDHL